jgi:hypothetical protein
MRTPIKPLPGQQRINNFMQSTPRNTESADFPQSMVDNQGLNPALEAAIGAVALKRRRRIQDDDDDDDETIAQFNPRPAQHEIIHVHDTADETDANFSVILLPRRNHPQPATNEATLSAVTTATSNLRQSGHKRPQPQMREPAKTVVTICVNIQYFCGIHKSDTGV